MQYEKITLFKDGILKEYDLIKEMSLDKYHSKYLVFTDDVTKENLDIYIMKVLEDDSLEEITGEELEDCKKVALEEV